MQRQKSSILWSIILLILFIVNTTYSINQINIQDIIKSSQHECPARRDVTKLSSDLVNSHKILECNLLNKKNKSNYLPDYLCNCKYSTSNVNNNCLLVYVGMAIKGYNLVYKQWINTENCMNLCLNTTIKNGYSFDCKSFEHWHGNCKQNGDSLNSNLCASFIEDHAKPKTNNKNEQERRTAKLDYCVLSNQTINSSNVEFEANNVVTYYEILCSRPNINDKEKNQKSIYPTSSVATTTTTTFTTTIANLIAKTTKKSKNRSFSIKSKLTTIRNSEMETLKEKVEDNKCTFNPCLNGGKCILIEKNRFICSCDKFYYGTYCENYSIEKICHRNFMEILIYQEFPKQFNLKLTDFYVNSKQNSNVCRLKTLNETHVRFRIPYEKCSTLKTITNFEIVYTNKIYSLKEFDSIDDKEKYLLSIFECRLEKLSETESTIQASVKNVTLTSLPYEKITKSTAPCIMDLLNLKLEIFSDEKYENPIQVNSLIDPEKYDIEYESELYVEFSVNHSDKLNKISQIENKLKYFHLTIEKCWLTANQNENKNVLQVLINDGCPHESVKFSKMIFSKNSIRFSFNFDPTLKEIQIPNAYLHCMPQICTDANRNLKDYSSFYSQFKTCKARTISCKKKLVKRENEYNLINFLKSNKSDNHVSRSSIKVNNCLNKLSFGPIRFKNESSQIVENTFDQNTKELFNSNNSLTSSSFSCFNFFNKKSLGIFCLFYIIKFYT